MEDTELLKLWKSFDKKLEDQLHMNRNNVEEITKIKARSYLISMTPLKLFAIVAGILWVIFIDVLIVRFFFFASPFFLVSAALQSLLTTLAIGVYLYQVVLIQQVDINEPIMAMQQKAAHLKSSTLWATRILFLQLPLWTTFYLTKNLLVQGDTTFYLVQGIVTFAFTFMGIWLFININSENKEKKWFRLIFEGKEWSSVMQAMNIINQVKAIESASDIGSGQ